MPVLRGHWFTPALGGACGNGYALGFAALGLQALLDAGSRALNPSWVPSFEAASSLFNTYSPAIDLVTKSISGTVWHATLLLLSFALARRYLKSIPLVLIVVTGVAAASTFADNWVTPALVGLFWAGAFLRFGILSCVAGILIMRLADRGTELVTAGGSSQAGLALVTVGLLLLPLALAAWTRRRVPRAA